MVLRRLNNQAGMSQTKKGLIVVMKEKHEMYPQTRKNRSLSVYRSRIQKQDWVG